MKKEEILNIIQTSITSFTTLTIEQITIESDLSGDLALDSADRVELVLDLEEKFSTKIPQEDYSWCKTIEDLINLIYHIKFSKEVTQ